MLCYVTVYVIVFQTVSVSNVEECYEQCALTDWCKSVDYSKVYADCYLSYVAIPEIMLESPSSIVETHCYKGTF